MDGSSVKSARLKERLYQAGLKERKCEMCGQSEEWCGRRMSLILDHVNGAHRDNRLENLRIVCANCNATLETHCGRNARTPVERRACAHCGDEFVPKYAKQRYCSQACGSRWDRSGLRIVKARRAVRPPLEELTREVDQVGYEAVGRKYGVSGVAIRKWFVAYGVEPPRRRKDRQLSDTEAVRALERLAEGMSERTVAQELNVGRSCIADLRRGRTYRHVPRAVVLAGSADRETPELHRHERVECERAGVAAGDDAALAAEEADLAAELDRGGEDLVAAVSGADQ